MDDAPAEALPRKRRPADRAVIDAIADRYPLDRAIDVSPSGSAAGGALRSSATLPRKRLPAGPAVRRELADALVAGRDPLPRQPPPTARRAQRDRYQLVLHATAETLARDDDPPPTGSPPTPAIRIHPETGRRLSCDCPTSTLTVDHHGNPLHLGRRTRRIRGRVARASVPRPRPLPRPRLHRDRHDQPPHPALGPRRTHLPDQPDLTVRRPPLAGPRRRLDHHRQTTRRLAVPHPRRATARHQPHRHPQPARPLPTTRPSNPTPSPATGTAKRSTPTTPSAC